MEQKFPRQERVLTRVPCSSEREEHRKDLAHDGRLGGLELFFEFAELHDRCALFYLCRLQVPVSLGPHAHRRACAGSVHGRRMDRETYEDGQRGFRGVRHEAGHARGEAGKESEEHQAAPTAQDKRVHGELCGEDGVGRSGWLGRAEGERRRRRARDRVHSQAPVTWHYALTRRARWWLVPRALDCHCLLTA